jgi:hypothetical protein
MGTAGKIASGNAATASNAGEHTRISNGRS